MGVGVIVVAAGNGTRMGSSVRKPYLQLGENPILILTLKNFYNHADIKEMVLVVHQDEMERTRQLLQSHQLADITIVSGGRERQASVRAGVNALSQRVDHVMIHDGARPFVSQQLITRIIDTVKETGAVIPAIPVKDTIKVVNATGVIANTPDRKGLWAAQTPQAFSLALLRRALDEAERRGIQGTDDASLLEELEHSVHVIEGEGINIKITTPEDLLYGEVILRSLEGKR